MGDLPATFPTAKVKEMLADMHTRGVIDGLEGVLEMLEAVGESTAADIVRAAMDVAKALPPAAETVR